MSKYIDHRCNHCQKIFPTERGVRQHIRLKHSYPQNSGEPLEDVDKVFEDMQYQPTMSKVSKRTICFCIILITITLYISWYFGYNGAGGSSWHS